MATSLGGPQKDVDAEHIGAAKRMKADGHTDKDIAKYLGETAERRFTGTSMKRSLSRLCPFNALASR